MSEKKILVVEDVSKSFGSLEALKRVSFHVFNGEIFGIAGPNGAGKTTLYNVMTGMLPLDGGQIIFNGTYIQKLASHKICHLGLTRTFQIPELFRSQTVYQNVLVGVTFGKPNKISFDKREKKVNDILDLVGMSAKKDMISDELDLFDRKRLMIATSLATGPQMLMLDEPVGGLGVNEQQQFIKLVKKINNEGITIVLIEHVMATLMNLSKRVMILHHGEKICEGLPKDVANDKKVIDIYLGAQPIGFQVME